jgi:hypothetical protein
MLVIFHPLLFTFLISVMEIVCSNCGYRFKQNIGASAPCPKCGARVAPVDDAVQEKYAATRVLVIINKSVAMLFAAGGVLAGAAVFRGAGALAAIGAVLVGLILALFSWAAAEAFQIGLDIEEHLRATRQMTKQALWHRDRG